MPADASKTREKLIDEAARAFAADGVFTASLIDITRRAGQRNRGALHYHFGSRAGVLCAVLERHVDFLARREGELLELALARPDDDVKSVVEAIVRPATELAESGWRGRCFLVILVGVDRGGSGRPRSRRVRRARPNRRLRGVRALGNPHGRRERRSPRRTVRAGHRLHPARGGGSSAGAQPSRAARSPAAGARGVRAEPGGDGRGGDVGAALTVVDVSRPL